MINYNKLKLAHELAEKINERVSINVCYLVADKNPTFVLDHCNFKNNVTSYNIDDLITKLQELIAPKPKYEAGQEVYYLYQLKQNVLPLEISEINPRKGDGRVNYRTDNGIVFEEDIYPSREALIDAQIDYWKKLKMKSISESNE